VSERACERANRERARARSLGYARVDSRLLSLSRSLPLLPSSSLPPAAAAAAAATAAGAASATAAVAVAAACSVVTGQRCRRALSRA